MSMVAIFRMACCGKLIVFGRYRGNAMSEPTKAACPFGCPSRRDERGNPEPVRVHFVEYRGEDRLTPELRATWRFPGRPAEQEALKAKHLERSLKRSKKKPSDLFD